MSFTTQMGGTNFGANTQFEAYSGGRKFVIISPSDSSPILVSGQGGRLCRIHNSAGGACEIVVYDASMQDSETLAASATVFDGTLPATGEPLDLQIAMTNGIVVAATSLANDIMVTYI